MVTLSPFLLMSAFPIGTKYSLSGISPLSPYIFSDSITNTGSSSLMADFNNPFASYGVEGVTTLRPGTCA